MNYKLAIIAVSVLFFLGCGGDKKPETKSETPIIVDEVTEEVTEEYQDFMSNKGIGPVSNIELGPIDEALVAEGKEVFKSKCSACHKVSKRVVGPAMAGITSRRSPEWIMNMILNPEEMVAKDPVAKALLAEYLAPMANQSLTEPEARSILEYFRTK